MDAIGPELERPDRILEGEATIVVAVPVDANTFDSGARDDIARELNEVSYAVRRRVADGIREEMAGIAVVDGAPSERRQDLGTRSRRIFRHVANREACFDGYVDGFGAALGDEIDVPVFRVLTNRTRAYERIHLHGNAGSLRDLDHGRHVRDDGAARTGHLDLHLAVGDFLADSRHVFERALGATGKTYVSFVNSEVFHEMENLELFADTRIDNRGVLQPIPERLVKERGVRRNETTLAVYLVPVEHELVLVTQSF